MRLAETRALYLRVRIEIVLLYGKSRTARRLVRIILPMSPLEGTLGVLNLVYRPVSHVAHRGRERTVFSRPYSAPREDRPIRVIYPGHETPNLVQTLQNDR